MKVLVVTPIDTDGFCLHCVFTQLSLDIAKLIGPQAFSNTNFHDSGHNILDGYTVPLIPDAKYAESIRNYSAHLTNAAVQVACESFTSCQTTEQLEGMRDYIKSKVDKEFANALLRGRPDGKEYASTESFEWDPSKSYSSPDDDPPITPIG